MTQHISGVYIPRYHLYPSHPQILHQLVLELFLRAKKYEKTSPDLFAMVPHGPIYKYGSLLAEAWRDILTAVTHDMSLIIVVLGDMPGNIMGVVTDDIALHTWFGRIVLDPDGYVGGVISDNEIFAAHARPLEAQLPFLRAYGFADRVYPYILNITRDQLVIDDFLDAMYAHHGDRAVYVFVQPMVGVDEGLEMMEKKVLSWVERRE